MSKHAPEYCKVELSSALAHHGIRYLPFGHSLGGRPDNSSVYRDGYVDYDLLLASPNFVNGIKRIVRGAHAGHVLAIFCSEGSPERCHRSKAVGRALVEHGVRVLHVDTDDKELEQEEVLHRLIPPLTLLNFAVDPRVTSRRRYR